MRTQVQLGGLGPPNVVATSTASLPPDGDGFVASPYVALGLGVRRAVRYCIRSGHAAVARGTGTPVIQEAAIAGAEVEVRRWLFDLGTIRVFARDGQIIEWKRIRGVTSAARLLRDIASG